LENLIAAAELGKAGMALSDEFYSEITAHPIPTDIDSAKVLASW
jgi:hypothetical protein